MQEKIKKILKKILLKLLDKDITIVNKKDIIQYGCQLIDSNIETENMIFEMPRANSSTLTDEIAYKMFVDEAIKWKKIDDGIVKGWRGTVFVLKAN